MSLTATLFIAPYGQMSQPLDIIDIDEEDELWFVENNVKLSAEQTITNEYIVYADVGLVMDGEPLEAIQIAHGRSCRETMHALRVMAEGMLEKSK